MTTWQGNNNPGHKRRLKLWHQIEDEFGESIADIITGLREQGNSWRTVAGCLNTSSSVLLEWRKALGLELNKSQKIFDESSLPELSPLDQKAIALGYENKIDAIIDLRIRQKKTIKEAGKILGCHYATVSYYSPPEVRGTYNQSENGKKVHQDQCRKMNKILTKKRHSDRYWHPFDRDNDILFRRLAI